VVVLSLDGLAAAIVDLDGTLVDTLDDFVAALALLLSELGLHAVDRRFVARSVGKGSEHLVREALAHCGAAAVPLEPVLARYQHHYAAVNGRYARVFDGVDAGLDRLASHGVALACLTNKPTAFAVTLLERKGLARYFAHVFGGDAFTRRKPDPLPVLETCRALGSRPPATLVIGDSSNDAQAARGAGCPVVLVSYGYNHGEPIVAAGGDAVVDRLDRIAWPLA